MKQPDNKECHGFFPPFGGTQRGNVLRFYKDAYTIPRFCKGSGSVFFYAVTRHSVCFSRKCGILEGTAVIKCILLQSGRLNHAFA